MSDAAQTKILDSRSWILSLKHFTKQNTNVLKKQKTQQKQNNQIQYVIASTFDKWLALRTIDVQRARWTKIYDMKMTMPVVNSYIQFDKQFKSVGLVVAYFDGSIEYSSWDKLQKSYSVQIQAGKKRQLNKLLPQILIQTQRPAYINCIIDESKNIEQAFMLETVCFLCKRGQYIYAINLKGQLKILRLQGGQKKLKLVYKFRFQFKIVQAQEIFLQDQYNNQSFTVAICFQKIATPYIFQISSKTTQQKIQAKMKSISQFLSIIPAQISHENNVKLICFDPTTQSLITCTQKNQIRIYDLQRVSVSIKQNNSKIQNPPSLNIIIPQIEKVFYIQSKDKIQTINDLSIKNNYLLILCTQSFSLYHIIDGIIIKEGQKLKELLDMGKLILPSNEKGKPLILIKKKFNVLNPKQRTSTTLHLFTGK